jgi:hypothetical protein
VLDDVERGSLLVQPAGEDPLKTALRVADVELDEGAGQFLHFPGGTGFAGAEAEDHVAHPDRLTRLQLDVAGQAVALIEQAEHRHPRRHRRRPGSDGGDRLRDVDDPRLGVGQDIAVGGIVPAAAGQGDQPGERGAGSADGPPHSASGVQAW